MNNDRLKFRIRSDSYNAYLNNESLMMMRLSPDGKLYHIGGTIALDGNIEFCTGLKDKNGQLAFIGDLAKDKDGLIWEMIESEEGWGLLLRNSHQIHATFIDEMEIIGTIHDKED